MLVRCTCVVEQDLSVSLYDPECNYIIHRLESEVTVVGD